MKRGGTATLSTRPEGKLVGGPKFCPLLKNGFRRKKKLKKKAEPVELTRLMSGTWAKSGR